MISNANESKSPSTGEYVDIRKYIGVASINVLAVNPNNAKLRSYGWTIADDAQEPVYVTTASDGKKSARVRILGQIQDFDEKPVIALDFWIRPEVFITKDGNKAKIIDSFGRTAYGTKAEIKAKQIPQYTNSLANISPDYKLCHTGEEELVAFIMKYDNITPYQIFDRKSGKLIPNKNPGHLTIDNWEKLCNGDATEIKEYLGMQPNNRVKVILGVRTTDDNKTYQTFLSTTFIGNGAIPDRTTGEYTSARKAIDKYYENRQDSPYSFSAFPVKEWKETATEVKETSAEEDMPDFNSPEYTRTDIDDLPFGGM